VRRREDGTIVGGINVSQIFHGAFCSAYLGYYASASHMGRGCMSGGLRLVIRHAKVLGRWRDHEHWAVTVEDVRR
jgi:ribosomal-protein-alanine N-acetyltransferase